MKARHFIITNRNVRTGAGGKAFSKVNSTEWVRIDGQEEAMDNLRYGEVSFDPAKAKKLDDFDLQIYPDLSDADMRHIELYGEPPKGVTIPSRSVFESLRAEGLGAAEDKAQVLVYVHGFNSDLEGALTTLAEVHRQYVAPAGSPIKHIVMFTWPSRGSLTRYRDDARDAVKSGYAMARAFRSMTDFFREILRQAARDKVEVEDVFCKQKIHLLCHSMGNRVFEAMMQELRGRGIRPNSVFGQILLVAADVDDDCFEGGKAMNDAVQLGERLHVYYHNKDVALGISESTKNAFNRLGRWGPRRTNTLADDVCQADVTAVKDSKGLKDKAGHHWYYLYNPTVVKDMMGVMMGGTSKYLYRN